MVVEIDYTLDDICNIIGGRYIQRRTHREPRYLALDSRKVTIPNETLFWAIDSKSRKGSDFILDCVTNGVQCVVTQDEICEISLSYMGQATIIRVKNSLEALQKLAAFHRKRFEYLTVIGITGSNGKTIVKEWLAKILSSRHDVVKSPASYNSQIGVALSVLQIRDHHSIGIFEVGISQPGDMDSLWRMLFIKHGILTNIGSAHDEGFESREQKIAEKLKLFGRASRIIFPYGQRTEIKPVADRYFEEGFYKKQQKFVGWGTMDTGAPCRYAVEKTEKGKTKIRLEYNEYGEMQTDHIVIPFTDEASIKNAVTVYCYLRSSGYFVPEMLPLFKELQPVRMRLEIKPGINDCSIIDDSYSNDVQSLRIALDFLNQQNNNKKTLILSDFEESGMPAEVRYRKIAELIKGSNITRFWGVGFDVFQYLELLEKIPNSLFFADTNALIEWIKHFEFSGEAILVKGARHFGFERVVHRLETHIHQTVLYVNLTNLAYNIRVFKSLLSPSTKVMAMVKAFAYGTGSMQISSLLEYIKADYLTVAYTEEGIDLRKAGIRLPIMVLNALAESFDNIVDNELEPEIYSFKILREFTDFLKGRQILSYPIHLKFDTGMHRLGFREENWDKLNEILKTEKSVKIKSVFSHLSASDLPENDDFTLKQFETFMRIKERIQSAFSHRILFHIANSAAIGRFPKMHLDMVRLGIGMYGIDGNPEVEKRLKTVNRLTTVISQIRAVKAGDVVGYNANRITKDCLIATVGIGYADGFSRLLGNGVGQMLVGGVIVPTVGNVCMDMTMIDVSEVPDVQEGDEVVIFGEELPVQKMAEQAGTIPYEIFTDISPRVRRIYYEES